jgi:hypothetical protein
MFKKYGRRNKYCLKRTILKHRTAYNLRYHAEFINKETFTVTENVSTCISVNMYYVCLRMNAAVAMLLRNMNIPMLFDAISLIFISFKYMFVPSKIMHF